MTLPAAAATRPSALHALTLRSRRFGADEGGALVYFGLVLFLLMVMIGGFAIDLMRYEQTRTRLQNALDRCTLNAAALSQRLDPTAVVNDCIAKSGLTQQLQSVIVEEGENFRDVRTVGLADTNPHFLHLMGLDKLDARANSRAVQRISNVEIVLVLDVSGSMSGQKIIDLRAAASKFVGDVLAGDDDNRVSVSIVPYNAQVNIGPVLRAKYVNTTDLHGVANVNCLEIPVAAYASAAMPATATMPMMAYADIANGTNRINGIVAPTDTSYALPNYAGAFCKPTTTNILRLPGHDIGVLQGQINALQAGGNTSITLGMKWGVTLLDPAMQPMFDQLASSNDIPESFASRPFAYDDAETMKIVILMTDGEHVSHTRVADGYKTGTSPIYKSLADGNYSVFHAARPAPNQFWVPHLGTWQATAWNSGGTAATLARQNWENVWANLRLSYVAWQFYARALGTDTTTRNAVYSSTLNTIRTTFETVPNMNAQLQTSCAQAKTNGVIVYGIAFEAPLNGQTQISTCASSVDNHYYNATDGDKIKTAFDSIAANITQLRLTQ